MWELGRDAKTGPRDVVSNGPGQQASFGKMLEESQLTGVSGFGASNVWKTT